MTILLGVNTLVLLFIAIIWSSRTIPNVMVCRGMEQRVQGFPVRWKGSVAEPSIQTNGVYEAVIHPDGNAYADWSMTRPLRLTPRYEDAPKLDSSWRSSHKSISGCESSSCGSYGCGSSQRSGSSGCGSHSSGCGSSRC